MEHLYHYVNGNADGTYKIQLLDANDQIYFAYRGIDLKPEINQVFNTLDVNGKVPFKHGIYIQVKGTKGATNDSVWIPAQTNNRTIWVDIDTIAYSKYAINLSAIKPFEEVSPKKTEHDIMIDSVISEVETFLMNNSNLLLKILNNGTVRSLSELVEQLRNQGAEKFNVEQDVLDAINLELAKNPDTWKIHKLTWVNDENGEQIVDNISNDFNSFILSKIGDTVSEIITPETFDSWNFGIYSINNGSKTIYRVLSQNNTTWEAVELKTIDDFMSLLRSVENDQSGLLRPYVYSMITNYNPALNAIAEKASDYLYENVANPEIGAIYEQINNYLQKRLENGEC